MRRYVVWTAILAIFAVGGFYGWRYHKAHEPPPFSIQTEPVTRHHIVGKITATGTLLATVTVTVGTQVSGRVQKIFVDYNSPVKKGEIVAKIDPLLFQAALEQSRANLMQAQAQVESTKAQVSLSEKLYARSLALQKDNLAAQQDVDTAETNAAVAVANGAVARASLAQAQASLHQAEANLDYTNIVSPIDGTVISRSVDVGQTVAASLSTPTLFTIAQDLRKMQVNTNVSEGDVGRLVQGMSATFSVDAFPGQRFHGKISQIRNAATTTQNVVTYDAVIDVDNGDLRLRPGMTASSTVVYAEKDDALAVPNTALRFHPPPELADEDAAKGAHGHRHAHGHADGGTPDAGVADGGDAHPRHHWRDHQKADGGSATVEANDRDDQEAHERKTVWVERDGHVVPVFIHTGLTDGTVTEVLGDALAEGTPVIVDVTSNSKSGGGGGGGGGQRGRSLF